MTYDGPGEVWAPDQEPRQCRRWNRKTGSWQWKVRYETRQEAADGPGKGSLLYVCDECGFWHRASVPPDQRNREAVDEVVIQLFEGETVTGIWCPECALPSGTRTTVHLGSPSSTTTRVIERCEDDADHHLAGFVS